MPEQAALGCPRCDGTWPIGPLLFGCPRCQTTALEVRYTTTDSDAILAGGARRTGGVWDFSALLPLGRNARQVSLGEGWSPLLAVPELGDNTFVKYEASNPTGSFKDRLNAVAVSMALQLGYQRVLCTSTGNHGVSLAAYAAAAGLECLVVCSPGMEPLAVQQIRLHGARAIQVDGPAAATRAWLAHLVRDEGWWPSVRNHPRPFANPFGLEGYSTIAYELWHQSGGRVPDCVLVPTGGGDSLVGIARGFSRLCALDLAPRMPRLVACQPAAAAPLVQAVERGDAAVAPIHAGSSIAVSIAEDQTGDHALRVLGRTGRAVAVSEEAIRQAVERLGASGLCVDPASAASAAALLALHQSGELPGDETAVCVATAGGERWPAAFGQHAGQPESVQLGALVDS